MVSKQSNEVKLMLSDLVSIWEWSLSGLAGCFGSVGSLEKKSHLDMIWQWVKKTGYPKKTFGKVGKSTQQHLSPCVIP